MNLRSKTDTSLKSNQSGTAGPIWRTITLKLLVFFAILPTFTLGDEVDKWTAQLQSPIFKEYLQARGELRKLRLFGKGDVSTRANEALTKNDHIAREWLAIYGVRNGRSLRLTLRDEFAASEFHYIFSQAFFVAELEIVGGNLSEQQVAIINQLPVLRKLTLDSCLLTHDIPWRLSGAAAITLNDCKLESEARFFGDKVTRLNFRKCVFEKRIEFATPKLAALTIKSCRLSKDTRMKLLFPELISLDISGTSISSGQLQSLRAPRLVDLDVRDTDIHINDLVEVSRFPKLARLKYGSELLPKRILRALAGTRYPLPMPSVLEPGVFEIEIDRFGYEIDKLGFTIFPHVERQNAEFRAAEAEKPGFEVDESGFSIFPDIQPNSEFRP